MLTIGDFNSFGGFFGTPYRLHQNNASPMGIENAQKSNEHTDFHACSMNKLTKKKVLREKYFLT